MHLRLLALVVTHFTYVVCAPLDNQNTVYDPSRFDEVYDQRQNGSENYKVDVNGVVVVWAAPESALSALTLLELGLLDDYSDLEELQAAPKPPRPENLLVVSPEKPSSSTTTALPPSLATESTIPKEGQNHTARHDINKRKYRLPLLFRTLLGRRQ